MRYANVKYVNTYFRIYVRCQISRLHLRNHTLRVRIIEVE